MRINRGTSRPPCGFPAYYPSGLPAYRGGGISPNAANYLSDFVAETYRTGVTSQTFSDQYTLTRATTAWDVVDGTLEEYASGEPMISSKGLGVWEASTNLLTNNDGALATYPATAGAVADGTPFITGFSNAVEFPSSPVGLKSAYKTTTYSASTDYTFSCYIKTDDSSAPITGTTTASGIDLVVVMYGAAYASDVESVGGDVYRITCTANSAALTSTAFGILKYGSNSSKGFTVLGYQLEQSDSASPIIITEGSAVTRNADVIVNNAAISSWYNQSEGTIFVRSKTSRAVGDAIAAQFDDGTANDRHVIKYDLTADPDEIDAQTFDGGASQALISLASAGVAEGNRTAYAYKVDDFAAATDGAQTGIDTSGTLPTADTLRIGQDSSGNYLGGYIQKIEYYPRRLSQLELESITAEPPASSVFEFGADDTQVGAYLAGGTAMDLITPTKVRSTIEATDTTQAQFADGLSIPPAAGDLVIPAGYSDVVGYELDLTLPDLSATTFDGTVYLLLALSDTSGGQYAPAVLYTTAAGQWSIGDLGVNNLALGTGGTYRVAIDNDYDTDLITIRSGSGISYTSALSPSTDSVPVSQFSSFITTVGTGLGEVLDLELIQDSANFTETHVAGAVALADALEVKA